MVSVGEKDRHIRGSFPLEILEVIVPRVGPSTTNLGTAMTLDGLQRFGLIRVGCSQIAAKALFSMCSPITAEDACHS